jgi:molybdopterin molybdotransferase
MIGFDEAVRRVADAARPLGTERVALAEADGRNLAGPVVAQLHSPRTDVSVMDGYAVVSAEPGAALRVVGESLPGAGYAGRVGPGEAVRIFTGAPVPAGAERVVIQENIRREGDRAVIESDGEELHLRRRGSDFAAGDVLIGPGTLLGPRTLVAAAAADLAVVDVFRRPRLRVIATGDELADPGTARGTPQGIPDSISFGVAALARAWGAETVGSVRMRDDLDAMRLAADAAVDVADLIVVTGGASVGDRDFARAMFSDALDLIFSKVRIKPGKPVWLGRSGRTLVMGLPGNPISAMVTARLLLAPLVAGLSGRDPLGALRWTELPLGEPLAAAGDRETFSRGRLADGRVRLLEDQGSGAQGMLVAADLLVRREAGARCYHAGELVGTLPF